MCFSKRMKQSREKQGMTLAELGRKIGKLKLLYSVMKAEISKI